MAIAYLNGQFIPLEKATIPVWDYGFTMGVTLTEQLRTFAGRLLFLEQSLTRLWQGLKIVGVELSIDQDQLAKVVQQVVDSNHRTADGKLVELGVGIAVTPGCHLARSPFQDFNRSQNLGKLTDDQEHTPDPSGNTLLVYALPLNFQWAPLYAYGIALSTVDIREIPGQSLPKQLKCRSRMHYFLAEQQAKQKSPNSVALLQQLDGSIAEGTTASLLLVKNGSLIACPKDQVLPSLSVQFIEEILCPSLKIEFLRNSISLDDALRADELLWASTSPCILPVAQLDRKPIGKDSSRLMFQCLMQKWSDIAGIDLIEQAESHPLST